MELARRNPRRVVGVVSSTGIDPETARRHGIERGPGHGILNATVLRTQAKAERAVPAQVHARIQNLGGIRREVRMRTVRTDGYVSYIGTYRYAAHAVLDFRVEARPQGTRRWLALSFRQRMGPGP